MTQSSPPTPALDDLRRALAVSAVSLAWTLFVGTLACALGLVGNSLVLVSFGAVTMLDAAGSVALVGHFRHAVHHETFSEKHERLALNIVTGGMFIIGAATVAESLHRLAVDETSRHDGLGIALAAVSVVALAALSQIKRRVAVKVGSDALRADGWVSAVGALLALVTLAGTGLSAAFGWTWVDPAAATVVGVCAIAVSVKVRLDGR